VTLERTDLTLLNWLQHAQEEAMDLANYLEVIMSYMTDKTTIDAVVVLRDKIERNESITADDRRVFLAALNRILNNYLQQQ
jgi:3-hydroxyacyl-CoA dehydrogenase